MLCIQRKLDLAHEVLRGTLKEYPNNYYGQYLLFRIYKLKHEEHIAASTFRQLIQDRDLWEAKLIQELLMKDKQYDEIIHISENFLQKDLYDERFLQNYLQALLRTAGFQESERAISTLLHNKPGNPLLTISLAKIYQQKGDERKALDLLKVLTTITLEQAEMLYRLKEYESSLNVYRQLLNEDPNNISAVVGVIKNLCVLHGTEYAQKALDSLIASWPYGAKLAMCMYLSNVERETDGLVEIALRSFQELMEIRPEGIDIRVASARLLANYARYREAIGELESVQRELPTNPLVKLRLARLYSWNKDYEKAITTYENYLTLKPYDLGVWREKARVYGWARNYEDASAEYQKIVKMFPNNPKVYLEKYAKEAYWKRNYSQAGKYYQELISKEPENGEALFELGQVYCHKQRYHDAFDTYRRLLSIMPSHQQAPLALKLSELCSRPKFTLRYDYADQEGYEALQIRYHDILAEGKFILPNDMSWKFGFKRTFFDFDPVGSLRFRNFDSNSYYLRFGYPWALPLEFSGFLYNTHYQKIDRDSLNFGVDTSYDLKNIVRIKLGYERKDIWENAGTLASNIYADKVFLTLQRDLTRALNIKLGGSYSRYRDDNNKMEGELAASYEILPYPHILKLAYKVESFSFSKKSILLDSLLSHPEDYSDILEPDYSYVGLSEKYLYFSPPHYTQNTLALEWRHYLEKEPLYKDKKKFYALSYGVSLDSKRILFHNCRADLSYTIGQRIYMDGLAQLIRSRVYDEDRFMFSLGYIF